MAKGGTRVNAPTRARPVRLRREADGDFHHADSRAPCLGRGYLGVMLV
jgi:hypothetical protein